MTPTILSISFLIAGLIYLAGLIHGRWSRSIQSNDEQAIEQAENGHG